MDRRRFLGLTAGGAAALGLGLSACTRGPEAGGQEGGGEPAELGFGRQEEEIGGALRIFSWEEYTNPENVEEFSARFGVAVTIDVYDSNEQAIEGLRAQPGVYDLVVPSNGYVSGMMTEGLLTRLDKAALPNLGNVDPAFLGPSWDPGNDYTVVKDWGSTGFLYDTTVVQDVATSWDDFFRLAALPQVSGRATALYERSVVDAALWRAGHDFRTEDPAALDAAEQALVGDLLPHLNTLDSYPVEGLLDETYVLSQAFSGDARTVVLEFPERYRWVMPSPHTDRWTDYWAVPSGAQNLEAAHAWIDFMLQPNISARELDYHGYATAVMGIEEFLPIDLQARDMIFFTPEQLERMREYEVGSAEDRRNEIVARLEEGLGLSSS
jgi:spermidine/putrescine transport system substrate-binding protein